MKSSILRLAGVLAFVIVGFAAQAQNSRQYIRENIDEWGQCSNVAITRTNGDVAIYGSNGWAASQVPSGMTAAFRDLHDREKTLKDIVLTEDGSWLILWGGNGYNSEGLTSSLSNKLRQFNDDREELTSVAFNDAGEWAIVGVSHIAASSDAIEDWLLSGLDDYGTLWSVHMTDDSMIAVYENGYKFLGDVPESMKDALRNTDLNVYRAKFAGQSWFFADRNGNYQYNM